MILIKRQVDSFRKVYEVMNGLVQVQELQGLGSQIGIRR
jgi:hypothetical protein